MATEMAPPSTTDHLRTALSVTAETHTMGTETLSELERQREQIARVQRKVDAVDAQADTSHHILRGMRSVFSRIGSVFSPKPALPADVVAKREAERAARREGVEAGISAAAAARGGSGGGGGPVVGALPTKDPIVAADGTVIPETRAARLKEEDELLAAIATNVAGIKRVGEAMGDELTRQDHMLDELATSVDRTNIKIRSADAAARKVGGFK